MSRRRQEAPASQGTIPFHPLANIFPLIEPTIGEVAADIEENGFRKGEEIVLLDGQILDGRTRFSALQKLVVEKKFKPDVLDPAKNNNAFFIEFRRGNHFDLLTINQGPLKYVVSRNLKRRHLTDDQRRLVAARIADLGRGGDRKSAAFKAANGGFDRETAAKLMHTDSAGVERARTVVTKGARALQDAVERGETTVRAAADIAKLPKADQVALLKEAAKSPDSRGAIRQAAKELRRADQVVKHGERQAKANDLAKNNPALPDRTWPIVVCDIPRKPENYDDVTGSEKSPDNHYLTMDFEEQLAFAIDRFAAAECVMVFASTAASLLDDLDVLAEWGIIALRPRGLDGKLLRDADGKLAPLPGNGRYGSHVVWHKQRIGKRRGMGRWVDDQHELWIIARRGKLMPAPIPGTQPPSCFDAPVAEHSRKPNAWLRAAIDRCWPDSEKVELFARKEPPRKGWTFWGNQAGENNDGKPKKDHDGDEAAGAREETPRGGNEAAGDNRGAAKRNSKSNDKAAAKTVPRNGRGAAQHSNGGVKHTLEAMARVAAAKLSINGELNDDQWRVFERLIVDEGSPVPDAELTSLYYEGRPMPAYGRDNFPKVRRRIERGVIGKGYRLVGRRVAGRAETTLLREAAE